MIEIPLEPADVASDELRVIPAPRPSDNTPEAWRAGIRASLPESQRTRFDHGDFVECATCCTKPGMPSLCAHCLANRATVHALRAALREALRYAREYYAAAYGGDTTPGELAHLDKLEELL